MHRSIFILLASLALMIASSSSAAAQSSEPRAETFEQPFSFGAYGLGWAGSYEGGGIGGRIGARVFPWLGVEGFSEHLLIANPGGLRHDHPIGFNLYVPIMLGSHFRLKPLLGACVVFSLIEPENAGVPRADDILFGVHAGARLDFEIAHRWTIFVEGKAIGYGGHGRYAQGWSGRVDGEYTMFWLGQLSLGVEFHFGA